jgi:reactive intermediate/imine deaminase
VSLRKTSLAAVALLTALWVATAGSAWAGERPAVEYLNSGTVLPSNLPFSEAVRVGDTLYLAGQIGVKPGTMELVEGGMAAEARQTIDNIKATLEAHGHGLSDVVKCTVMLADIGEWATFNEIYQSYFSPPYPARSAFGANGLAIGARVEVECIAAVRD